MGKLFWAWQTAQLAIIVFFLHLIAIENTRRFDLIESSIDLIKFYSETNYDGIFGEHIFEKGYWNEHGKFDRPIKGKQKGIIDYLRELQSGKIEGNKHGFIPVDLGQ